jgi:hypothetical protein
VTLEDTVVDPIGREREVAEADAGSVGQRVGQCPGYGVERVNGGEQEILSSLERVRHEPQSAERVPRPDCHPEHAQDGRHPLEVPAYRAARYGEAKGSRE